MFVLALCKTTFLLSDTFLVLGELGWDFTILLWQTNLTDPTTSHFNYSHLQQKRSNDEMLHVSRILTAVLYKTSKYQSGCIGHPWGTE